MVNKGDGDTNSGGGSNGNGGNSGGGSGGNGGGNEDIPSGRTSGKLNVQMNQTIIEIQFVFRLDQS